MSNCLFCGKRLKNQLSISFLFSFENWEDKLICSECFSKFEKIDPKTACPGCFRPQNRAELCPECLLWAKKYPDLSLNHRALFSYNEIGKEYMDHYKFQGDLLFAQLFKKELKIFLTPYLEKYDLLPLPISQASMEERGFNQVKLILDEQKIHYKNWLIHIGKGPRQSSKNRKERLESEQFLSFKADFDLSQSKKRKILLIDDIYTTGRTILHAKKLFYDLENREAKLKDPGQKPIEIKSVSLFR